eukprot:3331897-Rhodomonas_salina.1
MEFAATRGRTTAGRGQLRYLLRDIPATRCATSPDITLPPAAVVCLYPAISANVPCCCTLLLYAAIHLTCSGYAALTSCGARKQHLKTCILIAGQTLSTPYDQSDDDEDAVSI